MSLVVHLVSPTSLVVLHNVLSVSVVNLIGYKTMILPDHEPMTIPLKDGDIIINYNVDPSVESGEIEQDVKKVCAKLASLVVPGQEKLDETLRKFTSSSLESSNLDEAHTKNHVYIFAEKFD